MLVVPPCHVGTTPGRQPDHDTRTVSLQPRRSGTAGPVAVNGTEKGDQFLADHPCLFFIRESSTGTILFMGRAADPS